MTGGVASDRGVANLPLGLCRIVLGNISQLPMSLIARGNLSPSVNTASAMIFRLAC